MKTCISNKKMYPSQQVAEEALIEAHTKFDFPHGAGPVTVYQCEECGNYHLTSQGPMNEKLAQYIKEGKLQRMKEAHRWINKIKWR